MKNSRKVIDYNSLPYRLDPIKFGLFLHVFNYHWIAITITSLHVLYFGYSFAKWQQIDIMNVNLFDKLNSIINDDAE